MQNRQVMLQYAEYASDSELPPEDALLLAKAREVTAHAYAPYSRFRVGAAARLNNGRSLRGPTRRMPASRQGSVPSVPFYRRLLRFTPMRESKVSPSAMTMRTGLPIDPSLLAVFAASL